MATVLQQLLVPPVQISNSDAAYYTTPSNTTARIGRAVLTNTSASGVAVTVNLSVSTSSAANELIHARVLAAGESYVSPELAGLVIPATYMLRAVAGTAAVITLEVSGITVQ